MRSLKKLVIGANWKIYMKSVGEVRKFIEKLKKTISTYDTEKIEVYILPDFISLQTLIDSLGELPIYTGTQDIFWEDYGPYTGEVSPALIRSLGCKFVFIGHSERKRYFGENDYSINKKVLACYRNGLIPIILVGENLEERKSAITNKVLEQQLKIALNNVPVEFMKKLVVVYEPVWAIGQNNSASLEIIKESHIIIREILSRIYDTVTADLTRVIYGGSVNLENGSDIIKIHDVDGLAITRTALEPENLAMFIKLTEEEAIKRWNIR